MNYRKWITVELSAHVCWLFLLQPNRSIGKIWKRQYLSSPFDPTMRQTILGYSPKACITLFIIFSRLNSTPSIPDYVSKGPQSIWIKPQSTKKQTKINKRKLEQERHAFMLARALVYAQLHHTSRSYAAACVLILNTSVAGAYSRSTATRDRPTKCTQFVLSQKINVTEYNTLPLPRFLRKCGTIAHTVRCRLFEQRCLGIYKNVYNQFRFKFVYLQTRSVHNNNPFFGLLFE